MSNLSDANDSARLPPLREFTGELEGADRAEREAAAWERVFRVLRGRARSQLYSCGDLCRECSPEDIAQRTLTQAHRAFEQFRGGSEQQYFVWIFRIQDNLLHDALRRLQRGDGAAARIQSIDSRLSNLSQTGGVQVPDVGQETPSRQVRRRETLACLYEAIERLPTEQRAIVIARLGDSTFDEIALQMSTSKTSVLRRYQKALRTLKSLLGEAI